jgi:hypothetical protein
MIAGLLLGGMLVSCSAGNDVATLGSAEPKSQDEQATSADEFVDCLDRAGLSAEAFDLPGGRHVRLVTDQSHAWAMGDGSKNYSPRDGLEKEEREAVMARLEEQGDEYGDESPRFLIIGEEDHTDAWARCLDESGYQEPAVANDPAAELDQKRKEAADGVEWAGCARQNGYPSLADPDTPKADEWETTPMVILPSDMTEQALRDLLAKCPNFDADEWTAWDEAIEEDPESATDDMVPSQPMIGFDLPGFDGRGQATSQDTDPAVFEHLDKLNRVLQEGSDAYWDQKG